jgi:hypothetical protein
MTPTQRIEFAVRITPSMRARLNRILRVALVNGLCGIILCSSAPQLSAQRRSAIRVPTGETRPTPGSTTRKGKKEDEKPRAASRLKAREQRGFLTPQRVDDTGVTVGVPWTGDIGVEKSTAQIMTEQANAPAKVGEPRLIPEHEIPGRRTRPQDRRAQFVASTPSLPSGGEVTIAPDEDSVPTAPQTVSTNFNAVTGPTETGAFPPDTMGAVGPTQFFLFVNGRLRTFNKATGVADGVVNADPDVFFASVMTPPPPPLNINFTSDPQIRYDRLTARWIMIIIDVPSANVIGDRPNRILIAISDAASAGVVSAGTVWTFYFVQQDTVGGPSTGEFLDYPSLGVDANALYIGGDMFDAVSASFVTTSVWVIRKTSILSGGPIVVTAFRNLIGADGPFDPRGVDNYDPAATEGFFIGVSAAAFGRLNMRRIATPGGTPTISADIPITVAATSFPITVDHLGDTGGVSGNLDAIDDRLFAAHIRNGRLWTAHNIAVTAAGVASNGDAQRRDGARWYELVVPPTAGTPTVNQFGTVFNNAATVALARQFWFPTVMVSGQGHAALGFSTAGTPFRADAATNGRLVGDALGTTGAVDIYTTSTTAYNPPGDPGGPRRWGDYSFTSLDPQDDMTMWTIQEYCSNTNVYGTRVAKLLAPPPAIPTTAAPPTVPAGVASTSVVITGTSIAGSGFYDPGADLAAPALPFNHISATVTGGVTVNSTTFNTPTQVTLNISTVGATLGPQSVTITNPDGQNATGVGIITITPPLAPPAGPGEVLIDEFRFRGPLSAADEFVELYNNTDMTLDISGYTLFALTGAGAQASRFVVPGALGSNTTTIPARGHYLVTGASYSLAAAAASNGTLSTGIVDGSGVGFFAGATTAATRIDSAGFDNRDPLFFEGTPITPSGAGTGGILVGGEYSFVRKVPVGTRLPQDTGDNNNDFAFVSTTGGVFSTRASILGAPGPENLASSVHKSLAQVQDFLLDQTTSSSASPNRVRDASSYNDTLTPSGPNGMPPTDPYTLGTLSIRRRFVNNTGGNVTRLRFRIIDITTRPAVGTADLRALTVGSVSISGVMDTATCAANGTPSTPPCTVNAQGLTLEQPPTQASGGGLNSALAAGTVTTLMPLAPGASISLQFLFGVVQGGPFRVFITVEALP